MIYDSCYWKEDLLKKARVLERRKHQQRWPEVSLARLEQTVMLGFYSIRKLREAAKLSDSTIDQQVQVTTFPWSGKPVTKMNWDKIERLYDLASPAVERRDVLFLCHQIVHSYVFTPNFDEDAKLSGILFCSDRERHNRLFNLEIDQIIDLFEQVGNDYPASARFVFNKARLDYDVTST